MRVPTVWMRTKLYVQCRCKKFTEVSIVITNEKNRFRVMSLGKSCKCGKKVNRVAFLFEHLPNYDPEFQRFPD
jgi:hypothetical protein